MSANIAADRESVTVRETDIQDDGIVIVRQRMHAGRLSIAGDIHRIGLFTQRLRDESRRLRVVFDQEDPHPSTYSYSVHQPGRMMQRWRASCVLSSAPRKRSDGERVDSDLALMAAEIAGDEMYCNAIPRS